MKYDKPEITVLAAAIGAIQGCGKSVIQSDNTNCGPPSTRGSASAYEADE
jgi:hypothetical protein